MQTNTGNQGNTGEKFVTRFEKAVMQYVILNKAQQGEVTKDNLQQVFRSNVQIPTDHFQSCIQTLVQEGHLKENNNKYTITDDGREDIQKLQQIVLALPSLVQQQGGQQQRPGMQQTAGGRGATTGTTGTTQGNQGNYGSSSPQGGNTGQNPGQNR